MIDTPEETAAEAAGMLARSERAAKGRRSAFGEFIY
jgi:hypothetical protein